MHDREPGGVKPAGLPSCAPWRGRSGACGERRSGARFGFSGPAGPAAEVPLGTSFDAPVECLFVGGQYQVRQPAALRQNDPPYEGEKRWSGVSYDMWSCWRPWWCT